jgi:hypothetical protein
MPSEIRRIVTAVDPTGKSVIHDQEPVPAVEIEAMPGAKFFQIWGTEGALLSPATAPAPQGGGFFPGACGTRFGLLTFPPESVSDTGPAADEHATAEGDAHALERAESLLPGLLGAFEPDAPGMHQTVTVDYAVVITGELYLEVDDNVEVHLPTGSTVVQNGARHAWRNHSNAPATLAYVILGA